MFEASSEFGEKLAKRGTLTFHKTEQLVDIGSKFATENVKETRKAQTQPEAATADKLIGTAFSPSIGARRPSKMSMVPDLHAAGENSARTDPSAVSDGDIRTLRSKRHQSQLMADLQKQQGFCRELISCVQLRAVRGRVVNPSAALNDDDC